MQGRGICRNIPVTIVLKEAKTGGGRGTGDGWQGVGECGDVVVRDGFDEPAWWYGGGGSRRGGLWFVGVVERKGLGL